MNKRGLGRGLGALLGSPTAEAESMLELELDQIRPNPNQPRKEFNQASIDELAASLRSSGLIQPIVVRRVGQGYELIAGERRLRAARQAGFARIPAVLRDATDVESLELALVENLMRQDLNPIEEAQAYQRLLGEFGWTQEDLGQRVGKDRSSVANSLRLLKLPQLIQADLVSGRLTMGHARALLSLTEPVDQMKLRDEILAHSWSVRATEEGVQKRRTVVRGPRRRSVELAALEESLQRALMTRVRIVGNDRRGKIEITYATADELERLSGLIAQR